MTAFETWLRQHGLLAKFERAKAAGDFATCAGIARGFRWA